MRLLLFVACFCLLEIRAKTVKKTPKDEILAKGENGKVSPRQPAILAIEIVDSDEEEQDEKDAPKTKGKGKNSKRTIETSLGYGYQNSYGNSKPKFEIYKYSQNDIPSYKGGHGGQTALFTSSAHLPAKHPGSQEDYHVQKSITYELGTQTYVEPNKQNLFHPTAGGNDYHPTTLYSTLDQNGHLGALSQQIPYQNGAHNPNALVPVIILRVYTKQLSNPSAFYPNLPQAHPYSHLNNVNLQSLLGGYLQPNAGYQGHQPAYMHPPQYDTRYVQGANLDTHENYPSDKHTKVIFHKNAASTKSPPPVVYRGAGAYQTEAQGSYESPEAAQGYYYAAPSKQLVYEPNARYYQEQGQTYQYYAADDGGAEQYQVATQEYQAVPQEYQSAPQGYQAATQGYQAATQEYQVAPQGYQKDQEYQKVQEYQTAPQQFQTASQTYEEVAPRHETAYEQPAQYEQQEYSAQYHTTAPAEAQQSYLTPEPGQEGSSSKAPYNYHAHPTGRRNVEIVQQEQAGTTRTYQTRSVSTRRPKSKRTKKTVDDALKSPAKVEDKH